MQDKKLLLFDLDETLLRSDKTISEHTLKTLKRCREHGYLIGVCTSRGEVNTTRYITGFDPEIMVCSGGAIVKYQGEYIYKAEFTEEETNRMIRIAKEVCGEDVKITIDTITEHLWGFPVDPNKVEATWADSVCADFSNLHEKALKMCVNIPDPEVAKKLAAALPECDCLKFTDGAWHKFTKKEVTKGSSVAVIEKLCGISAKNMIAFGDDVPDIDMLQQCGIGVAMGNALPEVKAVADVVIGNNDEEAISDYLQKNCLM